MNNIELLTKIKENCEVCDGTGFKEVRTGDGVVIQDCQCVQEIHEKSELIKANVPRQYWNFDINSNLHDDFAKGNKRHLGKVFEFINNIDDNIENGNGLWFNSAPGLGKSSIISSILKSAIKNGKNAMFTRASHLITAKFSAISDKESLHAIQSIINDVDILAIEEIEKIYLVNEDSMVNQLFYEFMLDIHDSNKSLLISSNKPIKDVLPKFPVFIQDRLVQLESVVFIGKSGRRKRNNG